MDEPGMLILMRAIPSAQWGVGEVQPVQVKRQARLGDSPSASKGHPWVR